MSGKKRHFTRSGKQLATTTPPSKKTSEVINVTVMDDEAGAKVCDESTDLYITSSSEDTSQTTVLTTNMSPTSPVLLQKAKKTEGLLKRKIMKLNKEVDSLRQQLAAQASAVVTESESESPSSTTSSSSSTSSFSSSSEDEKKRKRYKKKHFKKDQKKSRDKMKRRHKKKKVAKGRTSLGRRACSPMEIIKRYKRVLRAYNSGMKLGEACAQAGVTELTVRSKAAIPELAIASPDKFKELLAGYHNRDKIADFVSRCEDIIQNDAEVKASIAKNKAVGKLIPYNKRELK